MSTKFCAIALEWWLKSLGKFDGSVINTEQISNTDQFKITHWEVNDVLKPTDLEINTIIDDYNQYLIQDKLDKKNKKDAILNKLKITEDELKDLLG